MKKTYDPVAARETLRNSLREKISVIYSETMDARSVELAFAPNAIVHVDDFDVLRQKISELDKAILKFNR